MEEPRKEKRKWEEPKLLPLLKQIKVALAVSERIASRAANYFFFAAFLAGFLAASFLAGAFFAGAFFAAAFLAGAFLAAGFFAVGIR